MSIETVLVLPLVLLILVAVIEVVAAIGTQLELTAVARESVRVAATVPDPGRAAATARQLLGGVPARVSVRRPGVVGRPAEVTISYDKPLVTPLLEGLKVPIRVRAVMAVER